MIFPQKLFNLLFEKVRGAEFKQDKFFNCVFSESSCLTLQTRPEEPGALSFYSELDVSNIVSSNSCYYYMLLVLLLSSRK